MFHYTLKARSCTEVVMQKSIGIDRSEDTWFFLEDESGNRKIHLFRINHISPCSLKKVGSWELPRQFCSELPRWLATSNVNRFPTSFFFSCSFCALLESLLSLWYPGQLQCPTRDQRTLLCSSDYSEPASFKQCHQPYHILYFQWCPLPCFQVLDILICYL